MSTYETNFEDHFIFIILYKVFKDFVVGCYSETTLYSCSKIGKFTWSLSSIYMNILKISDGITGALNKVKRRGV